MHTITRLLAAGLVLTAAVPPVFGQGAVAFQKPPKAILDLVDVENPPSPMADAYGRTMLLLRREAFSRLEDLSQPELKLAGLRINPVTHNASRTRPASGLVFQEALTGKPIAMAGLPADLRLEYPSFAPDGSKVAFIQPHPTGLALWVADITTGQARRLTEPVLTAVMGRPYVWSRDSRSLLVRTRPDLAPYRETTALPTGPAVQEALGVKSPGRTLQDLLKNPADEAKFTFYATHAVHRIGLDGTRAEVLPPALYQSIQPSPDGRFLLVQEIHAPFSYQFALDRFPKKVRVMDASGREVALLADKPLRDRIPMDNDATEDGRRGFGWRSDRGAALTWVEALDGGDPKQAAPHRDALYQVEAPFTGQPTLLTRVKDRFAGVQWGDDGLAVAYDYWWKSRHTRTYRFDPSAPGSEPQVLFDRSSEDVYGDPGAFVSRPNAMHQFVLALSKDRKQLWLNGEGCSPEGNRPFLDTYDLKTGKTQRLWRAEGKDTYEAIVQVLDPEKGVLLTSTQGPKRFPNLFLRTLGKKGDVRPLTAFQSPFTSMEGVSKETIKYKRADGVELSATLFLPPGYDAKKDGPLPVLMDAYPVEYKDAAAAGQLRESPHTFTRPFWGSPVYWTLRGYAVLENTQFPIVGQGKAEPNDTYVEQLVANAKAAIDEVARRGVGDPKRVACVGHSYGAFMVANLLAHSDLFAAGIARSGAYNRTLTPFGFQAEERSYWQARDVYTRMSPFTYADQIKKPILFIHGDADNNPGTFTLQSERLFQAVKGHGGKTRLVLLPLESHSYAAKENILHMLWEQDAWLEKWVKNVGK